MAPAHTRPDPAPPPPYTSPARHQERVVPPLLRTRTRPVSSAATQVVPLAGPLGTLFPDGVVRRGTVVHVVPGSPNTGGTTSLAIALLAAVSGAGGWTAMIGVSDPGVAAIADAGVDLGRLVLVPDPGARWAEVTAAALGGTAAVVVRPPASGSPRAARRLAAITRERRSILVVATPSRWAEPPDIRLVIRHSTWTGLDGGHGHLRSHCCDVLAEGRRAASRPVTTTLWFAGEPQPMSGAERPAPQPTAGTGRQPGNR